MEGSQPWHIARQRKFSHLASQVLHPSVPLHELFEQQDLRFVGVRSLQTLAAKALQQHLLATIAAVEPSAVVLLPPPTVAGTPEGSHHGVESSHHHGLGTEALNSMHNNTLYNDDSDGSHHSCKDGSSNSQSAQGAATDSGCNDGDVDDDDLCGICFDAVGGVRVAGCGHALCAGCAGQLARQVRRSPAACPFCRGPIGGFCARG